MTVIKRYLKEGDSISSPMVFLQALLCTLFVDAHEGCNMATFNVPVAFLHS